MPLCDLTAQYLAVPHGWTRQTLRSARSRIELVGAWLESRGVRFASAITPALVDEYFAERRTVVTHRTINRDWRSWRLAITWGVDRALCAPCSAVTERTALREARRTRRAELPSPDEVARVIAALRARDDVAASRNRIAAAAVIALYVTGLRIAELQRLTVGDLHDGAVWVRPERGAASEAEPGKSHRERTIPLADDAQRAVREYLAATAERTRTFSESWLIKSVHRACESCGVPAFGLHDLRRAAATEWHRAGVAVLVISRWLGHAEVRTTELYLGSYRTDRAVVAPTPRGAIARDPAPVISPRRAR